MSEIKQNTGYRSTFGYQPTEQRGYQPTEAKPNNSGNINNSITTTVQSNGNVAQDK